MGTRQHTFQPERQNIAPNPIEIYQPLLQWAETKGKSRRSSQEDIWLELNSFCSISVQGKTQGATSTWIFRPFSYILRKCVPELHCLIFFSICVDFKRWVEVVAGLAWKSCKELSGFIQMHGSWVSSGKRLLTFLLLFLVGMGCFKLLWSLEKKTQNLGKQLKLWPPLLVICFFHLIFSLKCKSNYNC